MASSDSVQRLRSLFGALGVTPRSAKPASRKRAVQAAPRIPCPKCKASSPAGTVRCPGCGLRLVPGTASKSKEPATPESRRRVTDEAQAPVVASLRDLSLLTDLQLRILVSARHEDPRGEVRAWTAPADAVGVAAGSMRFDGPEAIEAVKLLLGAGHLRRNDMNTMSLTTFGRRLAELASESPSVAARLQGPARTPSRIPA